jgi:pantetheine-phosphate adenylyltransferase
MTTAVYAGSFDPVTLGHIDIVRRGCALFEQVIVAVGHHPKKRYWFDAAKRQQLFMDAIADLPNCTVMTFEGLLVDFCARQTAPVILRGVRSTTDADYEMTYATANRDLAGVETVFLTADPKLSFLSSSLVKEISGNGGDVSRYVPAGVLTALSERSA